MEGEGRRSRPGPGGCTYVAWTVPGRRATSILYLAPVSSLMVRFWPKRCPSTLKYTAPSLGWILRETLIFTRPGMSPIACRRGGGLQALRSSRPLRGRRLAGRGERGCEGEEEEEGGGRGGAAGSQPAQPFPKAADDIFVFSLPLIVAHHLGGGCFTPLPPAPSPGLRDLCSCSDCSRFPRT